MAIIPYRSDKTARPVSETGIDRVPDRQADTLGFLVERTECISLTNSSLTDSCQRMHSLTGGLGTTWAACMTWVVDHWHHPTALVLSAIPLALLRHE